jgi:hypothetical protein
MPEHFGRHVPTSTGKRAGQSPAAIFTRGLHVGGTQWKFQFSNAYGASVIDDGYGAESGLYELAVLRDGAITHDTPITDDVLGYLTEAEVAATLDRIAALPAEVTA